MSDDTLAITNLKARYCATADSTCHDGEAARARFAPLFTDDFTGDYGMATFASPDELISFLCTSIGDNSEWMIHFLTSPRIVVDGDTATGDWAILVHSKRRGGERMEVVGRYWDEFRRTPNGWRISKITFRQYN
jgi:SnoaL-like domain